MSRTSSAIHRCGTVAPSAARLRTATRPEICPRLFWPSGGRWSLRARAAHGEIAAGDFFAGYFESALAEDEMLTEIRVPKTTGGGWNYQKFNRRAQDWAIVGVAAAQVNGSTSVSLVNMGSTPLRATAVEEALAGGASASEAAEQAAVGTQPPTDLNASPEYREHLARVLTRRALEAAGIS